MTVAFIFLILVFIIIVSTYRVVSYQVNTVNWTRYQTMDGTCHRTGAHTPPARRNPSPALGVVFLAAGLTAKTDGGYW